MKAAQDLQDNRGFGQTADQITEADTPHSISCYWQLIRLDLCVQTSQIYLVRQQHRIIGNGDPHPSVKCTVESGCRTPASHRIALLEAA